MLNNKTYCGCSEGQHPIGDTVPKFFLSKVPKSIVAAVQEYMEKLTDGRVPEVVRVVLEQGVNHAVEKRTYIPHHPCCHAQMWTS